MNLIAKINQSIVNPLIVLLSVVASAYFLWGLAQFVMNADNAEARDEGKRKIIYGLIGLTIMVSVFGILQLLLRTFGIDIPAGLNK